MEQATQRIGRQILDAMPRSTPSVFARDFWQGKLMDWSMRDEAFKVEMFRFVDVFPVLDSHEEVARHVQEYFCRPEQDFPAWVRFGLESVSSTSLIARTAARQIEKNIRAMASGFVAGEDAGAALPVIAGLRDRGIGFTVDLLGEATVSEAEAASYQARYAELIDTLAAAAERWPSVPAIDADPWGPIPKVNVSIKLSSLYSQLDPIDPGGALDALAARLTPLLREAKRNGVFVNLDMEQFALRDLTYALFERLVGEPEAGADAELGVVVQAYLRDSLDDTRRLCELARRTRRRITVRLVKGAYWDYETVHAAQHGWPSPVFADKARTDANYEACARLLIDASDFVRTAIGSHNVRSIAAALAAAEARGLPASAVEIQMLYGMAGPLESALASLGYRVREYVPIGQLVPGMAYLVRRLLENTSNEGFLRARFVDGASADALLAPPQPGHTSSAVELPESPFHSEPPTDFARADARAAFAAAVSRVRDTPPPHRPLVIGGAAVDTAERLSSEDPARSGRLIGTTASARPEHVQAAVEAAYRAFAAWGRAPAHERAAVVRRVADTLRQRRFELAALMVHEVAKNWREADADVAEAIDFCRYYADEAERLMAEPMRLGRYPGELDTLEFQPLGVGAVIAPWNFPLAILTGMTIGAIVTGNCVVIKPAEQSPIVAGALMDTLTAAGVPPGVVNYLPGRGELAGAALVDHPWTRFVAFTGSRDVGLEILRKAAEVQPTWPGPKRVVCEMGGKNAIIVDSDADLDEAVAAVVQSAFGFQGQKCSACSRVIVLPANYDAFVGRLVEAVASLEVGPPESAAFAFGPVIDADARRRVLEYIEIGRSEGTALLVTEPPEGGNYVPFAVFGEIGVEHRLAQEEIFGPVLAVMRARDFRHALELANATSYALTGAVISRSPANIALARREFRVGNLYINRGCTGALVFRQPFGGFKYSGVGAKAGGPNYLKQFVDERAISENTMRRGFSPET